MPQRHPSRTHTALFYISAFAFLYLRAFRLPAVPFLAEGDQILFFTRAQRILDGQLIYRDFFEMVTPGTEILHASVLAVTGARTWVLPVMTIALGMLYCWLLVQVARRLCKGLAVFLPASLFLALVANNALDLTHHWYSAAIAFTAIFLLADGVDSQRVASASTLCGLATLFTQTQGAGVYVGVCAFVLWKTRGLLAQLIAPYVAVVAIGLGCMAIRAGGRRVFHDLVLFPLLYMSGGDVNSPRTYLGQIPAVHAAADILHLLPVLFVYALVPYVYLVAAVVLYRRYSVIPQRERDLLMLLLLVGTGLFLAIAPGPRLYRLSTVAFPAVLLSVWLIRDQPAVRRALTVLGLCFFVLSPTRKQTQHVDTLTLPTGRAAFQDPFLFREYEWLVQRTRPGDVFFNEPGIVFYLSLKNPTESEFISYGEFTQPERVAEIVRSLGRHPPQLLVMNLADPGLGTSGDHAETFRRYVFTHYQRAETFYLNGSMQYGEEVWEKRP